MMNDMECTKLVVKLNLKPQCKVLVIIVKVLVIVNILVKGTITVAQTGTAAAPHNRNKNVTFKNCAPFTDCMK